MKINVATDFTLDTPHYWDSFWTDRDGLGVGGGDPDSLSKKLQLYHQTVWSRELPCGEKMEKIFILLAVLSYTRYLLVLHSL